MHVYDAKVSDVRKHRREAVGTEMVVDEPGICADHCCTCNAFGDLVCRRVQPQAAYGHEVAPVGVVACLSIHPQGGKCSQPVIAVASGN